MVVYIPYRNSRPLSELKGRKPEDGLLFPVTVIEELSTVTRRHPFPGNMGTGRVSASPPKRCLYLFPGTFQILKRLM